MPAPLPNAHGMARTPHPAVGRGDGILAGIAIPSALGTPTTGSLAAGETVFYQVDPITEGTLVAELHSGDDAMRLSLLNGGDRVLEQGDVPSPANPDALIDLYVPAGLEYLEVENLGGASTYTLTASFMAASTRFGPIAISVADNPAALVTGDFTGNGRTDLAVVEQQVRRRVGVAGQRRRHLPGPGGLRGGLRAHRPRGG